MKALAVGLIIVGFLGMSGAGLCANKETSTPGLQVSVDSMIQQGPGLLTQGEFKQVLSSISALPIQAKNDIRVRCLECFANLSGWRRTNSAPYKAAWMGLRQKLIYVGDSEVTPLLVDLLKDKDSFVREYAAELLGYIGDKRALDALQTAGKADDNRGVRKYAKWASKQISDGLTPVTAGLPALATPRMEIPVAMAAAGPIATGKSVSFVNDTEDFKITLLGFVIGDYNLRNCYADLESWTDIIVEQLEAELQKRGVKVITPGGPDARRVVIGVLNMTEGQGSDVEKKDLMEKMGQKPLVRLVDIPEYNNFPDLLKNVYEKAEGYKNKYQVDMLLHISRIGLVYDFSLIDLDAKKMQIVSLAAEMGSLDELTAGKLSDKVLANPYLNRVLRSKKKAAAMAKASAVPASDLVFSVWVKEASVAEGLNNRCTVIALVKQREGQWSKTYTRETAADSTASVIDDAVHQVVEAMLKDPAFRKALSP